MYFPSTGCRLQTQPQDLIKMIWEPRGRHETPRIPLRLLPLLSFSTFHSPLMRTPPNYFSGWSVGTQPELDPLCSDVTAMLMKEGDQ